MDKKEFDKFIDKKTRFSFRMYINIILFPIAMGFLIIAIIESNFGNIITSIGSGIFTLILLWWDKWLHKLVDWGDEE